MSRVPARLYLSVPELVPRVLMMQALVAQALSSPDLTALVLAVAWQAYLYPPACRRLQQS
ncbi:MAG: hypothetical protein M3120_09405 [Pseudomonadota bacterium]|nr:hypothetical protein [Pseudomonadota bacterium]